MEGTGERSTCELGVAVAGTVGGVAGAVESLGMVAAGLEDGAPLTRSRRTRLPSWKCSMRSIFPSESLSCSSRTS